MLSVRGYVVSLVPSFGLVDDVMQEVFITVTSKASDFEEGTDFRAWVFSIARYKVLEAIRKNGSSAIALDAKVIEALSDCESSVEFPEDQLAAVQKCKESLAPQARRAIELRYEQAQFPPEIATKMGWTVNAVNVALSRARRALRDCVRLQLDDADTMGDIS